MAKEGSVAPKERINITFKPATGGAQEEIELPLKLLAVGDYPLPANKTRTVFKTLSSPGGGGFNELRIEDKKGAEQIFCKRAIKTTFQAVINDASPKTMPSIKEGIGLRLAASTLSASVHLVQSDTTVCAQRSGLMKEP